MAEVKVLTYYEDLFAQYVGSYGFTVREAYCKAFFVPSDAITEQVIRKAESLYRRKHIKEKIFEYRKAVEQKSIKIASGSVSFEKEDAIKNIQKVLQQCNTALNTPPVSEKEKEEIIEFLERAVRVDNEGIPYKSDKYMLEKILSFVLRPEINPKVADVLLKANRQACEIYNLVNTDVALKADETITKLTNQLEQIPMDVLEKIAYPSKR